MPDNHVLAEQDYLSGMKYQEIADKYEVSINTVKSWKQRYGWSRKKGAHKPKSMRTNKGGAPSDKEPTIVINSDRLTDKQVLFVSYYLKYWNATKAYQKAYNSSYAVANVEGPRLLVNPSIKEEVQKARDEIFAESFLSSKVIIQKYMDIAFADITDFVEFGTKEESYMNEDGTPMLDAETGEPMTYKRNYVVFNSSSEVDGTIISEVVQGKNGVSVKLADRMKALEKLEKYVGFMTEEEQLKIKKLKGEIALIEQKANTDDDKPIEIVIKRKGDSS